MNNACLVIYNGRKFFVSSDKKVYPLGNEIDEGTAEKVLWEVEKRLTEKLRKERKAF